MQEQAFDAELVEFVELLEIVGIVEVPAGGVRFLFQVVFAQVVFVLVVFLVLVLVLEACQLARVEVAYVPGESAADAGVPGPPVISADMTASQSR